MNLKIYPIVLCGGTGSRLWPLSRPATPKQFNKLLGEKSLFQLTVERVRLIEGFERLIVVAGKAHGFCVNEQLSEIYADADILLEPNARGSAPAVAVATAFVKQRYGNGVAVIVASDHYIPDAAHFCREISEAVPVAASGRIVALGIAPRKPSSSYGYIKPVDGPGRILPVDAFIEKPSIEKAKEYIQNGYLWNSGNFIVPVDTLTDQFEKFAPGIVAVVEESIEQAEISGNTMYLGGLFEQAQTISIDHLIMERTDIAAVLISDLQWSDLGTWDAIHDVSPKDSFGNSVVGDGIFVGAENSHLRVSGGHFAVVSHIDGINVIVDDDVVFVSGLHKSQNVKDVVTHLKFLKRPEVNSAGEDFNIKETAAELVDWLTLNALPLWWCLGFDHENNIWRESLTSQGKTTGAPCRARVQSRQSYAYAVAGHLGWNGPWKAAVKAGFDSLTQHYTNENGLVRTLVSSKGCVVDETSYLYDYTFMLLALGILNGIPGQNIDGLHCDRALVLLDKIEAVYRRKDGRGYQESGDHPYQSNPHLHLFETAIIWCESIRANGGDPERWTILADQIASLAVDKLIDSEGGFIREFYDADWNPAKGKDGKIIDCGHQFEWASLLARWSELCGEGKHFDVAKKLFVVGTRGINIANGVVVDRMNDDLTTDCETARLWPQTGWLKASLVLHDLSSGIDKLFYREHAMRSCSAMRRYLTTASNGLWFDKIDLKSGIIEEASPASSLYHIVSAILQLQLSSAALE